MIPLTLLIMLPVVPSAVFLLVGPSLIAVGFGLSFQLLSRGFSFRHDGGEGGRWKREGEGSGKARIIDQTADMTERAWKPLSVCLSDQGRGEVVAQEGAQNSVKKGVYFGTRRSRRATRHSPFIHPGSPCSRGASV